jgi:hypothetical protein
MEDNKISIYDGGSIIFKYFCLYLKDIQEDDDGPILCLGKFKDELSFLRYLNKWNQQDIYVWKYWAE